MSPKENFSPLHRQQPHMTAQELNVEISRQSFVREGATEFIGKCFHDEVFSDSEKKSMDLAGLNLAHCIFRHADMSGVNLTHASLEDANLESAKLYKADLTKCNLTGAILVNANLDKAILRGTLLRAKQLGQGILQELNGDYDRAREVYRDIKNNFENIGAYDDASWAYFKERAMERKAYFPLITQKPYAWKKFTGYAIRWLAASFQELIWGYGQRPFRVIGFCIIIVVAFAVIFQLSGGVCATGPNCQLSIGSYLIYSLASFTTSSVQNLQPVTDLAQVITSFEGMFGVASLALFTTALAQRMGNR